MHLVAETAEVAACAGTEGEAGHIGFDEGVVAVALAAAGVGEMVVADLLPAEPCEFAHGVGVVLGLHVEAERRRECAFFNHAVDGQEGVAVEGVGVEAGQGQACGAFDVVRPNVVGLAGQAENQVGHNHGIEAAQFFQVAISFFAAVFAPETAADGGVEGLNADGNAVHAGFDGGAGFVEPEMADAAFEGEFAVVGQRQVLVAGADEAHQVGRVQCGGRAAAEIHGLDFAVAAALFGFGGQLFNHFVHIHAALFFFPGVAVETAEHAVVGAEGDVEVGQAVFIERTGDLALPQFLPLRHRHGHAAPNRHQRLPFGKGLRRGFFRRPADGLDGGRGGGGGHTVLFLIS